MSDEELSYQITKIAVEIEKVEERIAVFERKWMQGEELTREEIVEFGRYSELPKCAICHKLLSKDFLTLEETGAKLCSETCLEEIKQRVELYGKRAKEMEEMLARVKREVAESKQPTLWTIHYLARGLKKDYEQFMGDLPEILKKYGLE